MGRKKKQQENQPPENSKDLSKSFREFTSQEQWEEFFTMRGSGDYFEWYAEWYAEWPQFQSLLTDQLLSPPSLLPETDGEAPPAVQAAALAILVPGCGNSRLSEHLYDAGFRQITNVDFSKVVIADMLRRNVRERPEMKWRVMDMTHTPFEDKTISAIIDKGGLDALMVPELGFGPGSLYLSEVKRLLKAGGKYICLTLAESHVSDELFSKFRFGWKMSLYTIPKEPSSKNRNLQTFMVVVEKDICASVYEISSFMDNQVGELYNALEREQNFRSEYSNGCDILYSLKDLNLGVKGDLKEFEAGRRINLILGEPGGSQFYKSVLLDAQQDAGPFSYQFAPFLVPKIRDDDWLFSSEEGQKVVLAKSRAARLLIIFLDSSNSSASMEYIQLDLTPLVNQLAPRECDDRDRIPFMTISEGIHHREIVHQVTSTLTGPIVVDEVIYLNLDDYDDGLNCESEDLVFRRLTFQRSRTVVQSEALLSGQISLMVRKASKPKKKEKQRRSYARPSRSNASNDESKVDHNYLARSYHNVIISGLMLISLHLKRSSLSVTQGMVETVVIGLGGGSLPMFMKNWLPSLKIEVVEVDPVVLDVAKEHFGFSEDERLHVSITDGIQFVRERADSGAEGESSCKLGILIIDVNAPNLSSALKFPSENFVEESFLQNAKNSLSEEGIFIINLASRSSTVTAAVYSSLKKVFGKSLLHRKLEDDSTEVIFGLKNESPITEDDLSKACDKLERSFQDLVNHRWSKRVITASKLIRPLG